MAWTGLTCFIIFYSLAKVKLLRVDTEKEFRGKNHRFQLRVKIALTFFNGNIIFIQFLKLIHQFKQFKKEWEGKCKAKSYMTTGLYGICLMTFETGFTYKSM